MITVTISGKTISYSVDGVACDNNVFFQYDYGHVLEIKGLTIPDESQIHFAPKDNAAYIALCTTTESGTTVNVPQKALEIAGELNVYVFVTGENSGITKAAIPFVVRKREKPGNYAPPDEPYIIEELQADLQQIIDEGIQVVPDEQAIADAVETYFQENLLTNNLTATIPGTALDATQGKILNDNKLDKTGDSQSNTSTFTEAEIEADITSGETHAVLFGKILKSLKTLKTTITNFINTKGQANGLASLDSDGKVPSTQLPTASGTGDMLSSVYDTQSKNQDIFLYAKGLFDGVTSFTVQVVAALPTENIDTHTIYFVPKTADTNDNYDEFMYINSSWEHIGSTTVDLSNYVPKADIVDNLTTDDVTKPLSAKQGKVIADNLVKTEYTMSTYKAAIVSSANGQIFKRNGIVTFSGYAIMTSPMAAQSNVTIFTLPEDLRPSVVIYCLCVLYTSSASTGAICVIGTDGTIKVYNRSSVTTYDSVGLTVTYKI